MDKASTTDTSMGTLIEVCECVRTELQRSGALSSDVLQSLVQLWLDPVWAADSSYLEAVVSLARKSQGNILECGCGLTTILLAMVAEINGSTLWSLENNTTWARRLKRILRLMELKSAHVLNTSLKQYGLFYWYDAPPDLVPGPFNLVVCDGPPGTTIGGRYGLLPIMKNRLSSPCTVLLDDSSRLGERIVINRWMAHFTCHERRVQTDRPFSVITIII